MSRAFLLQRPDTAQTPPAQGVGQLGRIGIALTILLGLAGWVGASSLGSQQLGLRFCIYFSATLLASGWRITIPSAASSLSLSFFLHSYGPPGAQAQ
ncbi:MAG: hypothetical protein NZV14_04950 [Bryobacteraceae bacterium]|nr:hypothetical protein [Bryobacteraceae bacterium]MDW8377483.1 hypothetical protein [Bryobacterales bacterium]